ncbi:hypothetical protein DICVIV_02907 [Dictyocaulus viviparus]|uniref:Uncharacterized protein n=1 Tax=Dictyocaulus viviparus TaxID=29172 RepID=A0A0D8Y8N4_DICVI|nr:hypothetical protein DICVIV_02907 [Dictyocaulus viviparus]
MTEDDHQESDGERELSDSDSELDLDISDYEKRREHCLRQIILSEIQFNKLKNILKDLKIRQLVKRREDVINQTDPEFMAKHRELLEEFDARNKLTEAIRCLEMDSLERRTLGLKKIAQTNQDDNKIITQEKIREQIINEIRAEKQREIETKIVKSYFLAKRLELKRDRSDVNLDFHVKKARFNIPVIIHQLTEHQIEADIRSAELAILIADIKKESEDILHSAIQLWAASDGEFRASRAVG